MNVLKSNYLVVASLHDVLFESDRFRDVGVLSQRGGRQQLQLGVELDLEETFSYSDHLNTKLLKQVQLLNS